MKKIFSVLLILFMLVFGLPAASVSAEDFYVAQIGTTQYTSLNDAIASADAGQTVEIIVSDTYDLPDSISKNITISAVNGVIANCEKQGNYCYIPNGCNFKNITFNFGNFSYSGFQHAGKIKMTNCILNGYFNSYGEMEFNACTFNAPGSAACPYVSGDKYSMWVYGDSILYENCIFNCAGKCINIYDEGLDNRSIVRFNNCTFASIDKNKAAINVKETCGYVDYDVVLKYDVYIDENCKISSDSMDFFPTPADSNDRLEVIDRLVQVDDKITSDHVTTADADAGVNVYWKGKMVYSTYSDPEPDPEPEPTPTPTPTPTPEPKEEYTAPVDAEGTIDVKAEISDNTATLADISKEDLEKIVEPTTGEKATVDSLVIDLSQAKQEINAVELPKSTVENLADVTASQDNKISTVTIVLSNASVEIDSTTLQTLSQEAQGDSIRLVVDGTVDEDLNAAQQETLKDVNVCQTFEAYFESNGQEIHNFKTGIVVVKLKFKPEIGRDSKNYSIYYIDDNGKLERYPTKYQDGNLVFATSHFSDYVIAYDEIQDILLAKASTSGDKAIKLTWNKIDNVSQYDIYGAKCGNKVKKLASVKTNKFTVKKIRKKLVPHTSYKFYVVGYDAVGNKVRSKTIHFITANTMGWYANVKSIKSVYSKKTLKAGQKLQLKAKYTMYEWRQHLGTGHGKILRFISTNPYVASVSSTGRVTANKVGKATIFIQDIGGKYCKTEIEVK